jgi:hypothetical protein
MQQIADFQNMFFAILHTSSRDQTELYRFSKKRLFVQKESYHLK